MAWITTATTILRNLINDAGTTVTYSDERLEELLVSAAFLTNVDIGCVATYTVNMVALTVTPDPLDNSDYAFIYVVVLRARLMITETEFKVASSNAFSFRDGPSSMDGRASSEGKKSLMVSAQADYNKARLGYIANNLNLIRAIIGPHNIGNVYSNSDNRERFY